MEEVQYIYSGTDSRRLLISGNKAVIIAGDGEVTKLKFWFPETHDKYTKEIEWSFWIRDFEDNLINPRYFLTNNEFIIPTDVTYLNSGRQLEFAIIFKDPEDPLFEERSLLSPVYVSKGAKYLEEPPPMSALLELMEKAYITSAYDVDSHTDRPIITFTSCEGLLYTLLLDMPYLNESGKIPSQFFSNDQVVTVFQIDSISEITSLDAKSPDMARITAGIEEGDIYILIGEDSTDIDNWYPIYSQSSLNSKLDDTQLITSWSQTTSDSNIPSEKLVKTTLDTKQATITGGATSITTSNLTASRALISDTNGKVSVSPVTVTELGYVDGVTSAIQTQIDSKQNTLTFDTTPTASSVNPVTSDGIKTALDTKQNNITGGATTITSANLTASRALVSNTSGKVVVSSATATQLGYLVGVTSAVQTQLNSKVALTGNQSVAGVKTFTDNLNIGIVGTPRQLSIKGDLLIEGNITQNGSSYETHAQQVYTTDDKITLRDGATAGLIAGATTGLTFKKYDGINDGELAVDSTGVVRVGDIGDEQPLATRNESDEMTDDLPTVWDADGLKLITRQLTREDVGLSNVDNTSDVNKPISTATQTALSGKVSKSGDTMTGTLDINTNTQYPLTVTTDVTYPFRIRHKTLGKNAFTLYQQSDGTNPSIQLMGPNSAHRWDLLDSGVVYRGSHRLNVDPPADENTGSLSSCRWVNSRLSTKQDNLTFDSTPVSGSVNPVTSGGVYNALATKQDTITGGATSITSSNLTASRALVSNGSGKVAVSDVTSTELGYLDGVTSAVQTQLNSKASNTNLTAHTGKTDNPHSVTKAQVGLGAYPASPADIGISTATQTALDGTVKKTGNETIDGLKIFTNQLETREGCVRANTPGYATYGDFDVRSTGDDKCTASIILRRMVGSTSKRTAVMDFNVDGDIAYSKVQMRGTPGSTDVIHKGYLDTRLSPLATDSAVVHKTGNETINGIKIFAQQLETEIGLLRLFPNPETGNVMEIQTTTTGDENCDAKIVLRRLANGTARRTNVMEFFSNGGVAYSTVAMRGTPGATDIIHKGYLDSRLTAKQDNLTFDDAPVSGSVNPVTSGGIKTAIDAKVNRYTGSFTGDNSLKSFQISHNLNDAYPNVTVWKTSGGVTKITDVEIVSTSANIITLTFAVAPTSTDSFNIKVVS